MPGSLKNLSKSSHSNSYEELYSKISGELKAKRAYVVVLWYEVIFALFTLTMSLPIYET
jgi:hypothetical protein